MFKLPRKIRRLLSVLGVFEILTVVVIICYLYFIGSVLDSSHYISINDTTTKLPSLFSIPKRIFQYSSTESTFKTPKKCPVTIAIILCEDDRYLSFKNRSNFSPNSTSPPSHLHHHDFGNKMIAKDFSRQINQTLVLLKSIAILSKYEINPKLYTCVEVLLLSDKPTHYKLIKSEIKNKWSKEFQRFVKVTNVPVRYPAGSSWMRKMFRPCATLRLFLAEILPETWQSIIYLDTDFIFFQSVQALWSQFDRFDEEVSGNESGSKTVSKKVAAMAPCLFHYGSSANSVPYFGSSGLNAGIMLMNLTRMRGAQWTNKIRMVTTMFQDKIKLADQDILNIYFHFFPEELHLLTCDWNFRPFQCRKGSTCEDPEISQGISALHGNALSFTTQGPEPLFRTVFQTFHKTKLDSSFKLETFVEQLEKSLLKTEEITRKYDSQCKQFEGLDVLLLNRLYSIIER